MIYQNKVLDRKTWMNSAFFPTTRATRAGHSQTKSIWVHKHIRCQTRLLANRNRRSPEDDTVRWRNVVWSFTWRLGPTPRQLFQATPHTRRRRGARRPFFTTYPKIICWNKLGGGRCRKKILLETISTMLRHVFEFKGIWKKTCFLIPRRGNVKNSN